MTVRNLIKIVISGVVVIVAMIGVWVLAAQNAYRGFAERAHRTEALNAMSRMVTAQEQFRLRNQAYANDLAALGFADSCTENCVYLVSLDVAPDAQTYIARFVPNPAGGTNGVNQTGDEGCQSFTINARGIRTAENQKCLEGR